MYAVRRNCHEKKALLRRRYAHRHWRETTPRTRGIVNGSGPQSFRTCEKLLVDYGK